MKNLLFFILLLFCSLSFSQGIVVDTISMSVPELIETELLPNACSNATNFQYSSHLGIGKFTNTNPVFPFLNGIILRNGIAKYTEGPYTGLNESTQVSTLGDVDLQNISNANFQTATIKDVSYFQFDFTPLSTNFSFDFLFASNEYGQYQCGFSDVFGFILTDLSTGVSNNLAVIPSTNIPVSVKNIRDSAYNNSCLSSNANLFSRYNVTNVATSAINMRGETKLLTASSPVIPNRTYRIKLAIGDYLDTNYDSAVFINGGSFITSTNIGPDRSICQNESILLDTGLGDQFTFSWLLNGVVIPGENSATILANQVGTYSVSATIQNSGCVITDEIIITDLQTNTLNDISVCNSGQATYPFDLTQNNIGTLGLDPSEYSIMYFATLADANANSPQIPAGILNSYSSAGNETIYVKLIHVTNGNSICDNVYTFNLLVNSAIVPVSIPNNEQCDDGTGSKIIDISAIPPAGFDFSYFLSESAAQNNTNAINNSISFSITLAQSPLTIWVRQYDIAFPGCFAITNFSVTLYPKPLVDEIDDVIACSNYTLPVIVNGNYYTGANGSGILHHAGDVIDLGGTYYIFNGPIFPGGCTNESNFSLTFIDELTFPTTACGGYSIPEVPEGDFFTGPGGSGTLLAPATILTSSQTIYFYAVIDGVVCRDEAININVDPLPIIDNPANVLTCNTYSLPPLVNGNYFTGTSGTGTALFAGNAINSTQTIYVFADNGTCASQNPFQIAIVDTSIYQPISRCGSFILPAIPFGKYYDQPLGGGNIIPAESVISTSQIVYYYVTTSTNPNCTDNLKYDITIYPIPVVPELPNLTKCIDDSFVLPQLTNGNYFDQPNGGGNQLSAGTTILQSGTYYIYEVTNFGCFDQDDFTITYRPIPGVDSFTDVFTCTVFTLPIIANGVYYTAPGGPNGGGTLLIPGTDVSTSQTIYIYNEWPDLPGCYNETYFSIEVGTIDVGTFSDVEACDSYTLPPLVLGDYYSLPNGEGPIIPVGTVLTTSQTIYVYILSGVRLTCTDQDDFNVTISTTPVLPFHPDVEACLTYTLPPLTLGNYFSGPGKTGTSYVAGQSITNSQKMYIYVASPTNTNCTDEDNFEITIYPLNNLSITGGTICVDYTTGALLQGYTLMSGLSPAIFTVQWYLDGVLMGTGTNYYARKEGTYDIIIIKNTPDIGDDCGYNSASVVVEKSSSAIANLTVTDAFTDPIDIIVNVTGGFGNYEFQMDGGLSQTSNVFQDVASGEHIIHVIDTKGACGDIVLIGHVLRYPHYFTPNGDGIHDTWNIWDLSYQPTARIFIFDRYGKFLKEMGPAGQGWDGTFNGEMLPSTDYWFQVYYKLNQKEQLFKAHFSMKR